LNRVAPTIHIADLLYRPEAALNGKLKVARTPFTYLNRIMLKRRLKKELNPMTRRVRQLGRVEVNELNKTSILPSDKNRN
jgi:hypothetical protein